MVETTNNDKPDLDAIKKQLDADIKTTQDKLVSVEVQKEIEDATKKAKEQARVEFEKENIAKEQDTRIKQLEEQIKIREKEANDQLLALKKKVDEMTSSKAVYTQQDNPFNKPGNKFDLKSSTEEEYRKFEQESKRLFLEKAAMSK